MGERYKPLSNRLRHLLADVMFMWYAVTRGSSDHGYSHCSVRTQHLDALCADCLTFTAAPPHQSSQPGVQSVYAPSVPRSHIRMHQPNVFTPSLKPPPVPMPCSDGW
jgi:hypothetical protein